MRKAACWFVHTALLMGCGVACSPNPHKEARPVVPPANGANVPDSRDTTSDDNGGAVTQPGGQPAGGETVQKPVSDYDFSCGPEAAPGFEGVATVRAPCQLEAAAKVGQVQKACFQVVRPGEAQQAAQSDVECWLKTVVEMGTTQRPNPQDVVSSGFNLRLGADTAKLVCVDGAYNAPTVAARVGFGSTAGPTVLAGSRIVLTKTSLHCRPVALP